MLNIQKQTFTFLRRYGIISVFQGTERKVKNMRITIIDGKQVPFSDVKNCVVFKYNNNYYIKLRCDHIEDLPRDEFGSTPTVVCLEDGSLACFVKTTLVEVVDAELKIKE